MKPLTEMTAAELVGELAKRSVPPSVTIENIDPWFIKSGTAEKKIADNLAVWQMGIDEITAELERRCEDWQMKIDSMGSLFVSPRKAKTTIMGKGMNWRENSQEMEVVISDAAEFHALVGYLLQKGGKG